MRTRLVTSLLALSLISAACGGSTTEQQADSPEQRSVALTGKDFSFEGLEEFSATQGESIEFVMKNEGPAAEHEFEVFAPDDKVLGEIEPTTVGATGKVVLALDAAGEYRYVCGITGHEDLGMKGTFTVS